MKNVIRIFASATLLIWSSFAQAEFQFGVGIPMGQVDTSGTETEGTAADTSNRSKDITERFIGVDLFGEYVTDSYTIGLSYVPFDVDMGSGSRADSNSEGDTGTRKASAELEDFTTIYTNIPMGSGGWYGLLGYHFATVSTEETLNASSYGNADIEGYQIGFGHRNGGFKYEFSYSDMEDISLTATGGNSGNKVTADADVLALRISVGF